LEKKRDVYIRNAKKFLKLYFKNKSGIAGLIIIVFFLSMGLLAPYLTPYDPLYTYGLADFRAKPEWLDPSGTLPRNMYPVADSGFTNQNSLENWLITGPPSSTVAWNSSEGYSGSSYTERGSGPGCIVITATNDLDAESNDTVTLVYIFNYPYSPPGRFSLGLAYKSEVKGNANYAVSLSLGSNETGDYLLWQTATGSISQGWSTPSPPIDSNDASLKLRLFHSILVDFGEKVFPNPGTYRIAIRVWVSGSKGSEVRVFLDDIELRIWGEVFGLLGTDVYGRDIFTQLTYGSRLSFLIGILSAVIATFFGLVVGLVSGYMGGLVDELLMRINDILITIPALPLLMVIVAVIGASVYTTVILIGFLGWMSIARLIRSQVITLKEKTFVEAARASGGSASHIMVKHMVPSVMTMVYSQLALTVPSAIITEAALSFLGLGDPYVQTWGRMLHDVEYFNAINQWWWAIPPGLCIALLSLAFVLVGHGLDEVFNPKLRKR
jgi:peptide/nickel transport system permease protein